MTTAVKLSRLPLLVVVGLAFAIPTAAHAGNGYENVTSTFGGPCKASPCPAGQFKEPTSVAVDDETGDVYVLDRGDDRVERFTAGGTKFEGQFNGSGEYEVVGSTPAKKTGTAAPTGKLLEPEGIAVDNDPASASHGDVYVADQGHAVVDKFSATGEYEGQFTGGRCEEGAETPPCAGSKLVPFKRSLDVGVDSSGDLWVYEVKQPGAEEEGEAYGFSETGSFVNAFKTHRATEHEAPGFAVDANGDLFANGGSQGIDNEILKYEQPSGAHTTLVEGRISPLASLAIIFSTGDLLLDTGSSIELFKAPLLAGMSPILTFPSTGLSDSGGIAVNGAKGEGTIYASQRGDDDVDVLESEPAKAPVVVSESASTVGPEPTEGKLEAVIDPENRTTTYLFEYSNEASTNGKGELELEGTIETVAGEAALPAEFGNQTVTSPTIALRRQKTTYYRVVAENEESKGKSTFGKVEPYTKVPLITGEAVSNLTSTSATLEAAINPVFEETEYAFEYSTSKAQLEQNEGTVIHGSTGLYQLQKLTELTKREEALKKEEELGSVPPGTVPICPGILEQGGTGTLPELANKPCPVSAEIYSLQPGQTYYYRVVTENPVTRSGTNADDGEPVISKIKEFTPYAAPAVATGEAQDVTGTSATLSGVINSEGAEATYRFLYISRAGYEKARAGDAQEKASPYAEGESTASFSLPASDSPQAVGPIRVLDLLPGETYYFALVAVNAFEIRTVVEGGTFTTQAPIPPEVTTGAASSVTQTTATLTGVVATNGLQTSYSFEIGTEPEVYGSPAAIGSLGGVTTAEVTATITSLQPGTTYYYRVTATSIDGTVKGAPQAFTTIGLPYPLTVPATLTLTFPASVLPKEEPITKPHSETLTRKQKLAKALKACRKDRKKSRRQRCEKAAKKKYKAPAKK
jgi:hypothetical protein